MRKWLRKKAYIFSSVRFYLLLLFFLLIFISSLIKVEPYFLLIQSKDDINDRYVNLIRLTDNISFPVYNFILKNRVIFFNSKGSIKGIYTLNSKDIVSRYPASKYIITYSKTGGNIKCINDNGIKIWERESYSYPFMVSLNKILLLTGENAGFQLIDTKNNDLSDFMATGSIALSFQEAFQTNLLVIGFSDGTLSLYNDKLKEKWSKRFITDSIYPIVKSVAISSRGNFISAVGGLNDEYFYLLDRTGNLLLSIKTGENIRRPLILKFSVNETYVIKEGEEGFQLYSVEKRKLLLNKKLFKKSSNRKLISLDISRNGNFILVSYKYKNLATFVDFYSRKGVLLYRIIMRNDILPYVKFDNKDNKFIVETSKGLYIYGF